MANNDVFEDVLNLEEQYYQEGYELGVADGSKSGRIEGRIFGLEKGFEKFLEMGKLNGKATVWEARLPSPGAKTTSTTKASQEAEKAGALPQLSGNERLRKHIERLAALSDPNDLSTKNDEDEVSAFDDRLKDAKAKATLITRIVGEDDASAQDDDESQPGDARGKALRVRRNVTENAVAGRKTGEMEDFLGLPTRS
ncbi:Putative essential protein Yae1 [Septoria linicola]|uniref:Essential protein Yae1 n=1 Tax=Septoria linicola TaxID=215465 RepID=A0A9Q9B816_9PEZI|nr:putative essential protein Yae1 [Septoria linicola]USW58761.1 Putative essential protein Yae1 [Septoria linicola]